jgi:hypothetical protein
MKKLLPVLIVCLFACVAQTSATLSLEDVQSGVTIEQMYEFGTEIKVVAKKKIHPAERNFFYCPRTIICNGVSPGNGVGKEPPLLAKSMRLLKTVVSR